MFSEDLSVVPNGTDYAAVQSAKAVDTLLYLEAEADAFSLFLQNLLGKQRFLASFKSFSKPLEILPLDIIEVTYPLQDLIEQKMQVLSVDTIGLDTTNITAFF